MEIRYQGRAEPACEKAAFSASMVYVSRAASLRLTGISLLPTGVFSSFFVFFFLNHHLNLLVEDVFVCLTIYNVQKVESFLFFYLFFKFNFRLEGNHNIGMVSAIHRHESAKCVDVSPPTPSPPQPSGLSQSTGFGFPVSYSTLPLVLPSS